MTGVLMISPKLKYILLAVVFILGYTSLSFELIVLRQLINFVGSNTLITSVVITFILLFLSVGYYIGSVACFSRRPVRQTMLKLIILMMFWYIVACSYYLIEAYFTLMYFSGIRSTIGFVTLFSALFLAFPSACLGFVTSVIGRIIHRDNINYTGRFMAVDTIGSVSGSLLTTLLFMPLIGVAATIMVLLFLTAVSALLLSNRRNFTSIGITTICMLIIGVFLNTERFMNPESGLVKDDAISRIEIIPDDFVNGKAQSLLMKINGSNSSKVSENENLMFEYVNFINDTFIYTLPRDYPRDILILGAGGFTIGLKDDFHNYTFLDIEKDLKEISEQRFLEKKLTPNKKFIALDAYLYMLNEQKKFDLIVVDVFSAVYSIPMNFVTVDFFNMVKQSLKENGIMVANIITSASFDNSFSKRVDNTLRAVFLHYLDRHVLQPYNPYESGGLVNVEYVYYNYPVDNAVYSLNKNTAVYGQ